MINVEFKSAGPGTCIWCKKDKDEVFTVAFSDKSFVGPMCKPDLMRAIRSKCEQAAPIAAVAVKPQGNAVAAK